MRGDFILQKNIAARYENCLFPRDICSCIEEMLMESRMNMIKESVRIYDVLLLIAENTPHHSIKPDAKGIKQSDIERHFNLNRFACKEILSVLSGGTLIQYYEPYGQSKYWMLTSRGKQIISDIILKRKNSV